MGEIKGMARRVRIQFEGAVYHVMARGDRRESIIGGDKDRRMFIENFGEACEKAGWFVDAWVLTSNHYQSTAHGSSLSKGYAVPPQKQPSAGVLGLREDK